MMMGASGFCVRIGAMRKILCAILVVLMVTPAMACGPFMRVAHAGGMSSTEQCHEQKNPEGDHGLKFFKDCYGVELQQTSTDSVVTQPDLKVEKIILPWMNTAANSAVLPVRFYDSHGPPYERLSLSSQSTPVFLKTGRLRL